MLFVAMSSPSKEYFLARWGEELDVPFSMGVGGAIDVLAGVTRRAPRFSQRMGLEWAFRLAQEPRRLFRRYLVTNSRFITLTLRGAAVGIARDKLARCTIWAWTAVERPGARARTRASTRRTMSLNGCPARSSAKQRRPGVGLGRPLPVPVFGEEGRRRARMAAR